MPALAVLMILTLGAGTSACSGGDDAATFAKEALDISPTDLGADPSTAVGPALGAMMKAFGSGPSAYNPGDASYRPSTYDGPTVASATWNGFTPRWHWVALQKPRRPAVGQLYLAGLQSVDPALVEAARLDGARRITCWRRSRRPA